MALKKFKSKPVEGSRGKIAIVLSEFHEEIAEGLLKGAVGVLKKHMEISYEVFRVPGAFEIPLKAKRLARDFDVIIVLGLVLKGDTYHFELVANEAARGCMDVMLREDTPIVFEVLACYEESEAKKRCRGVNNKGKAAAQVALNWLKK